MACREDSEERREWENERITYPHKVPSYERRHEQEGEAKLIEHENTKDDGADFREEELVLREGTSQLETIG